MFDALSFAELDGQYVELLPARTVLSMFSRGKGVGNGTDVLGLAASVTNLLHGNGYGAPGSDAHGSPGAKNG